MVSAYADLKATRHLLADGTAAYDAVDRLLRTTLSGDQNSTILIYTDDGNVLRETKPDGTWTQYTYDTGANAIATIPQMGLPPAPPMIWVAG